MGTGFQNQAQKHAINLKLITTGLVLNMLTGFNLFGTTVDFLSEL